MIELEELEQTLDQAYEGIRRQVKSLVTLSVKKLDPADSRDLRDCARWLVEIREVLLKQLANLSLEERKALLEKLKKQSPPESP